MYSCLLPAPDTPAHRASEKVQKFAFPCMGRVLCASQSHGSDYIEIHVLAKKIWKFL